MSGVPFTMSRYEGFDVTLLLAGDVTRWMVLKSQLEAGGAAWRLAQSQGLHDVAFEHEVELVEVYRELDAIADSYDGRDSTHRF